MSDEAYYPSLSEVGVSALVIALDQLEIDPLWLDRAECPYGEAVKDKLRTLWMKGRLKAQAAAGTKAATSRAPRAEGVSVWDEMVAEAGLMFEEIRDMKDTLGDDVTQRIAYFKAGGAAMEKVVQLGERAMNIKHVSDFQRRVLDVFDQVLTPEQRTRATEMLGK